MFSCDRTVLVTYWTRELNKLCSNMDEGVMRGSRGTSDLFTVVIEQKLLPTTPESTGSKPLPKLFDYPQEILIAAV